MLRHKSVRAGDTVVINLQRGFHVIEWILATLKAGATFVFVDPDLAESRRDAILSNCKPVLVIDNLFEDLSSQWVLVNTSSDDDESFSRVSNSEPESEWTTEDSDLAYIIYTSGSTGKHAVYVSPLITRLPKCRRAKGGDGGAWKSLQLR